MKHYLIKTLLVSLPEQSIGESLMITLPNNAIPIGIEVRPVIFPEGLFLHHLVPCDEKGIPIEEAIPISIYETAWNELSKLYGERLEQSNIDVMDSVLKGVMLETESEEEAEREMGRED